MQNVQKKFKYVQSFAAYTVRHLKNSDCWNKNTFAHCACIEYELWLVSLTVK